ncbi:hypothetical protein AJ80_07542 [Polytolypa hystricis UAMH7299]|uniref:Zn(2)-C6 fungal-type domain-containing protein n=1 Tax=Polytolypa hystricis (strain UAMH7299) TaxID=1447883 RepID=A0A2B7XMZ8_POLH7|nr:hypothetical protein AJ80_07542 [Polytolypa hystricis UAMH7299]
MPDISPTPSSWDQPIPQLSPDIDPSQGSLQEDLDVDSYGEEFELLEQLPGSDGEQNVLSRSGFLSHHLNIPYAMQPCGLDSQVESPESPDGHEDSWTAYPTTTNYSDAEFILSPSFFPNFSKLDQVAENETLVDEIGCLPPDQLHSLEDGFPAEYHDYSHRKYAIDESVQDLHESWLPNLTEEPGSSAHSQIPIMSSDETGDVGEYARDLPHYSSYLHGMNHDREHSTADMVLASFETLSREPSVSEFDLSKKSAEFKICYLCSSKTTFFPMEYLVRVYVLNCVITHQQGKLPLSLRTPRASPISDSSEETQSSLSSSVDSSPQRATHGTTSSDTSRSSSVLKAAPSSRKRKLRNVNSSAVDKLVKSMGIQIVQEDGLGGSISPSARIPAIARARRNGPLSFDGRKNAAMRRKDKSVCVWCRLAKKKCSGESPCTTCIEQVKTAMFQQPCVRADFFSIVESGTCNYISQRAVNHPTLDGSTRMRMELPESFEMKDLLSLLNERRGRFNIRARQSWGTLYVLDLNETYNYLKDLNKTEESSRYDLREFIDHRILKFNKWTRCVKDCDPLNNLFTLLSQWNNMPSRASYDILPLSDDDGPQRPMDVNDPDDRTEILLAAQLSRIFCRKLEVDGYRALQNTLNKNKWDDIPHESFIKFLAQLGQILLSLRWRVSWWELLGDGGTKPDLDKERYEERVRRLCQVLYFYYISVKLKLPSWMETSALDGVWSTYADAGRIWDDFPLDSSADGFEAWMARGLELITAAGVQHRIAKF